jgi:3-oxoacyl-[acyl-carrier protein] reductase
MKWILVTGDSGGLGRAIVETLLKNGDFGVIGISRTENDPIKELKRAHEESYVHLNADLSEPESIKDLYMNRLKGEPIYGLVNNAAWAYDDIVTNADTKYLIHMFNVNVLSPIMLTKHVIRDMVLHGTRGSIVHVSSISAHTGYKGLSMYASTKGALESFSKGVSREWGQAGIRSNCVVPGFMETEMSESLPKEKRDKIYRRNSLAGPTNIDSVANTVDFLLSEKAGSITGSTIHVDNGAI